MGRMTFVCDFDDGQEPEIKNGMQFMNGRVVAASDADLVQAVMVMDQKINEYKERERKLIDALNQTSDPLTKGQLWLFVAPVFLVCVLSLIGMVFGLPVLAQILIHWVSR